MLGGSIPDIDYPGTENKEWENKTVLSNRILPMFFFSLEKSENLELWDLSQLWNFSYLALDRGDRKRVTKGRADLISNLFS